MLNQLMCLTCAMQGTRISSSTWFNLSCQELQPLFQQHDKLEVSLSPSSDGEIGLAVTLLEARVTDEVAWGGGCSMGFTGESVYVTTWQNMRVLTAREHCSGSHPAGGMACTACTSPQASVSKPLRPFQMIQLICGAAWLAYG